MGLFGWGLPPGVTLGMIDEQAGVGQPMDCPVCADGKELDGRDCPVCLAPTCPDHGCPMCNRLEVHRRICAWCGASIPHGKDVVFDGAKCYYCDERCAKAGDQIAAEMAEDLEAGV